MLSVSMEDGYDLTVVRLLIRKEWQTYSCPGQTSQSVSGFLCRNPRQFSPEKTTHQARIALEKINIPGDWECCPFWHICFKFDSLRNHVHHVAWKDTQHSIIICYNELKMRKKNPYFGKWRIIEMEMWDQDFIDMETEGYFSFEKDELGYFQFGLVQGKIDYKIEKMGDFERLEFTWEGQDENDEALGRGWAVIKNDYIEGRFYFHLGDNSWFRAKKIK